MPTLPVGHVHSSQWLHASLPIAKPKNNRILSILEFEQQVVYTAC